MITLDTFGGRIHFEWDSAAAVTPLWQLPFFIEFLNVSGLFDAWVTDCPLAYQSNNASDKYSVLATLLLSFSWAPALRAHQRDSSGRHSPGTLVCGETGLGGCGTTWACADRSSGAARVVGAAPGEDRTATPWILDLDATVKCLYGKQEGAVIG